MLTMAMALTTSIMLPLILYSIAFSIALSAPQSREKASPFECGFDPTNSARVPFSLRFFLLAVLFLIFDIEIAIITPIPLISAHSNMSQLILTTNIFLAILTLGLLHEWNEGSLEWNE